MPRRSPLFKHLLGLVGLASLCAGAAQAQTQGLVDQPCALIEARVAAAAEAERHGLWQTQDWAGLCRYQAANKAWLAAHKSGPVVVFMGDSITEGWGRRQGRGGPGEFMEPGYLSRGISGQTTAQMLLRLRADVLDLRPKVLHLMAGTNDIAGNRGPVSKQDLQANIQSMVELARRHGLRVVLASILPTERFDWRPELKPAQAVREMNTWLRAYAAAQGLVYADYYTPMATESGGLKPELGPDGVHPNEAGYLLMEPIAREAIRRAMSDGK
ncbi:hypothetical protein DBR47_15260 [Paucibacter sp. KBW04]|uniref:GDSL-type esterase/lipase family protein n=1 Tax=Paucibacter sp. KBW04 TaxID=2153361 RepID=UPI000F581FDF|nr:GDSL-type esterase/lipase family protein [Paucibacter sp. KBW04]RQO57194.1 hypothetical protein DBR47_15260 [Paucibacter sp. KBW04]